jgi:hypothetical protein
MDPKRKAMRAEFNRQMRARAQLLAAERGLPESQTKPVLSRLKQYEVMKFCERHRVSYEWLLCGSLKGCLQMARSRPCGAAQIRGRPHRGRPQRATRELAQIVREANSIDTAAALIECYARTAAIEAVGRYQERSL